MEDANCPHIYVVGNVNLDLIMGPLDSWPEKGTEVFLGTSHLRVGGCAGNTAVALNALESAHTLIANRGRDLMGDWLVSHFNGSAKLALFDGNTSITVGVTHTDNERTFLSGQGNVENLTLENVLSPFPAQANEGDIVLLCSAFLTTALLPYYAELVHTLKVRGFSIALDTGWPPQGWNELMDDVFRWLPAVDYLLLNELEISELSQQESLERAIDCLSKPMGESGSIIVKQGGRGATAYKGGAVYSVTAPQVDVVDTVGAGDTFNTGFLFALQQGQSVESAMQWGIHLASHTISTSPRQFLDRQSFFRILEGATHG